MVRLSTVELLATVSLSLSLSFFVVAYTSSIPNRVSGQGQDRWIRDLSGLKLSLPKVDAQNRRIEPRQGTTSLLLISLPPCSSCSAKSASPSLFAGVRETAVVIVPSLWRDHYEWLLGADGILIVTKDQIAGLPPAFTERAIQVCRVRPDGYVLQVPSGIATLEEFIRSQAP